MIYLSELGMKILHIVGTISSFLGSWSTNNDNAKLQNIKKSKSIKLKARLNMPTPQPPEISLKDTYEIDIDIIVDVNYKVKRK